MPVTAVFTPSLTLTPMLAAPAAVAVKVAAASAALIWAAVPVSWMPSVLASASVTPPMVPLVAVRVTVRLVVSLSATVKSANTAAAPVVTDCALPGRPAIVGAALTSAGF